MNKGDIFIGALFIVFILFIAFVLTVVVILTNDSKIKFEKAELKCLSEGYYFDEMEMKGDFILVKCYDIIDNQFIEKDFIIKQESDPK